MWVQVRALPDERSESCWGFRHRCSYRKGVRLFRRRNLVNSLGDQRCTTYTVPRSVKSQFSPCNFRSRHVITKNLMRRSWFGKSSGCPDIRGGEPDH